MQPVFDSTEEWLAFDAKHLWHPYTSIRDPLPCYPIVSAEGVRLKLADGRELIDGMSSWWSAIHGYNHPALNAAMQNQMQQMSHVMFGGIAHPAAAELGKRLVDITPDSLQYVFLADSGSIAVEVSIKMALQYWYGLGKSHKNKLLTVRGGYHGDPFACMSVCDPVNGMHHIFSKTLTAQFFADRPTVGFGDTWDPADAASLRELAEQHHQSIAAIILEPIVQGAGGMHFYHPEYLRAARAIADEFELLLIFDEIATGFGRTGELFAAEHAGVEPDIMCLGKALTGGSMTLAATLANDRVADGISLGDAPMLMHGPTFMGNPLACATACASIDLLLAGDWRGNIQRIEYALKSGLSPAQALPAVADVRVLGGIGVIELHQPVDVAPFQAALVERGVWVRPFGRLVYVMPPYIISDEDLATLCSAIIETVSQEL